MTIKVLLLDIGGVLLTNGWDIALRKKAAKDFDLNFEEIEKRHDMVFDAYERGSITLADYLGHVVFYKMRSFTLEDVCFYIFSSVRPYPKMMQLIEDVKSKHKLKVLVFSNEGKELALDRFEKFPFFQQCIDGYIISGCVRFRKPDLRMYELAIGICQVNPEEIVLIDDRKKNLEPANFLGMQTIHHVNVEETSNLLHSIVKEEMTEKNIRSKKCSL